MKAVIQYTDCMQDKRNIYKVLSTSNCLYNKERKGWSIYPKIKIETKDYESLKILMYRLNNESIYGASLLKWRY